MRIVLPIILLFALSCVSTNMEGQLLPFLDAKSCLWGYVDEKGKFVIKPQFDEAWPFFSSGKAIVGKMVKQKNKEYVTLYGVINTKGKVQTNYKYSHVGEQESIRGFYFVTTPEGITGFINNKGEEIIRVKYSGSFRGYGGTNDLYFAGGFAIAVNEKGKKVYVDSAGNELVLKKEYQDLCRFSEGLAGVLTNDNSSDEYKIAFINTKGEEVIKGEYYGDTFTNFKNGLCKVNDKEKGSGYIDSGGKLVIPFTKYWGAFDFQNGMAVVKESQYVYGAIDTKGKLVIPFKYNGLTPFKNGIAAACKNWDRLKDSVYIITREGKVLHKMECEDSNVDFTNATIDELSIKRNGKWALVNLEGEIITPFEYSTPPWRCTYETDKRNYLIVHSGNVDAGTGGCFDLNLKKQIVPCMYEDISLLGPYIQVKDKERWNAGLYDTTGKRVAPCMFNEIRPFINGYAIAITVEDKYDPSEEDKNTYCLKHFDSTKNKEIYKSFDRLYRSFIVDTKGNVFQLTEKGLEKFELKEDK